MSGDQFFERSTGTAPPVPASKRSCHCGKHELPGGSFTLTFEQVGANLLPSQIGYHSARACRTYR